MRVHVIRHVDFEGAGSIAQWAAEHGHELTESLALSEKFPPLDEVGLLVIAGGPMGASDDSRYPWLTAEKGYLREAMDAGVLTLGVCLGAQLIAVAAGGAVVRNTHPEIGWYPVRRTAESAHDPLFAAFPDVVVVGHWHSDAIQLPEGAASALSSDATATQAFTLNGGKALGLQCHMEWTADGLDRLIDECMEELTDGGPYLATAVELLAGFDKNESICRANLWMLLDLMTALDEARR